MSPLDRIREAIGCPVYGERRSDDVVIAASAMALGAISGVIVHYEADLLPKYSAIVAAGVAGLTALFMRCIMRRQRDGFDVERALPPIPLMITINEEDHISSLTSTASEESAGPPPSELLNLDPESFAILFRRTRNPAFVIEYLKQVILPLLNRDPNHDPIAQAIRELDPPSIFFANLGRNKRGDLPPIPNTVGFDDRSTIKSLVIQMLIRLADLYGHDFQPHYFVLGFTSQEEDLMTCTVKTLRADSDIAFRTLNPKRAYLSPACISPTHTKIPMPYRWDVDDLISQVDLRDPSIRRTYGMLYSDPVDIQGGFSLRQSG